MQPGWESILDKDEKIIWQGRPDSAIVFRLTSVVAFIFGLFFAGFALFWMVLAAQAGGGFWMFGLLHFGVGVSLSFGPLLADAYKRRCTWYTLTEKRAFVATNLPLKGKTLADYPISPSTALTFVEGPPDSIHFTRRKSGKNGSVATGFDRIDNGAEVYRLMRDIQLGGA